MREEEYFGGLQIVGSASRLKIVPMSNATSFVAPFAIGARLQTRKRRHTRARAALVKRTQRASGCKARTRGRERSFELRHVGDDGRRQLVMASVAAVAAAAAEATAAVAAEATTGAPSSVLVVRLERRGGGRGSSSSGDDGDGGRGGGGRGGGGGEAQ